MSELEYYESESVADSTTSSVYTASVLDDNGVKLPKKKKRIIKGAKKRLASIFGPKKKESFGVDFSAMPDDGVKVNGGVSVMSTSGSTTGSVTSGGGGSEVGARPSVQQVQPGLLLKVRVIRGGERSKGQTEYTIQIVYNPEKKPHAVVRAYPEFEELRDAISEAKGAGETALFPAKHALSAIGVSLSEEQQQTRSRLLDAWTKDLICSYHNMVDRERILVRKFLQLDLSTQKDIYIQDKMANGMIEAPRASVAGKPPSGYVPPVIRSSGSTVSGYAPSVGSESKNSVHSNDSGSYRPNSGPVTPEGKRGASRRPTYSVTIANTTGNINSTVPQRTRLKPDLRTMGSMHEKENDSDAHHASRLTTIQSVGDYLENDMSLDAGHFTSRLDDDKAASENSNGEGLQENLLRIGMNKPKKKSSACCNIL